MSLLAAEGECGLVQPPEHSRMITPTIVPALNSKLSQECPHSYPRTDVPAAVPTKKIQLWAALENGNCGPLRYQNIPLSVCLAVRRRFAGLSAAAAKTTHLNPEACFNSLRAGLGKKGGFGPLFTIALDILVALMTCLRPPTHAKTTTFCMVPTRDPRINHPDAAIRCKSLIPLH